VFVLVFAALVATGFTDISTEGTQLFSMFAAQAHELRGCITDRSAFHIELDALRHHLYVFFLQAGGCTIVANSSTAQAGIDAALVLIVRHSVRLLFIG
jgi:hypothetical protein